MASNVKNGADKRKKGLMGSPFLRVQWNLDQTTWVGKKLH